jgi:hypothetical protein
MDLLSATELMRLAHDPRPQASPLLAAPFLLLDAADANEITDPRILDWLQQVPAPVIAVGGERSALAEICDMQVAGITGLTPLLNNIHAHPLAAATLVQTLRLTARLDAEQGLIAESLAYASLQGGREFRQWYSDFHPPAAAACNSGAPVELHRSAHQLRLTLNRPSNRNAMTIEVRDALIEALTLALADEEISSVLIDANGACFSTGGDLREFGSSPDSATAHAVRCLALPGRLLLRSAAKTTAYLHGACIGSGIEFPAFAGKLVAAPDSWFQLPELRYGLIPGAGGTVSIPRRIGRQRTAWLVLSGARIRAETALAWGLIDAIEACVA